MANETTAAQPAPKKTATRVARASKKASAAPTHETHGAVNPSFKNMDEMFGIKSVYVARSIDQYRTELEGYTATELHAHAHHVGVIPLDPREKLVSVLERKFMETQSKALPMTVVPTQANPEMLEFHKKFMSGR